MSAEKVFSAASGYINQVKKKKKAPCLPRACDLVTCFPNTKVQFDRLGFFMLPANRNLAKLL